MKTLIIFAILFISANANAQTSNDPADLDAGLLPVAVECSFRVTTKIICNDVIESFFAGHSTVIRRAGDFASAVITLSITDEAADGSNVHYTLDWKSKNPLQLQDFPFPVYLDQSALDEVSMMTGIMNGATVGLQAYLNVKSGTSANGQLVVVSEPKDDGSASDQHVGITDRMTKSPIFIGLDLMGSLNAQGNKPYDSHFTNATVKPEFAYLKNKYKIDLSGSYSYQKASVPNGAGYTNSLIETKAVNSIFVYSLDAKRKWNVAVIGKVKTDPNSNINSSTTSGSGLEYTIVPFRTTQNKELAFQVGEYFNTLSLEKANGLGHLSEQYFSAFAKIYFYWVKRKLSLNLSTGVEQNLKYGGYQKYSAGGSIGYQILRPLKINFLGGYSYTSKSLSYPVSPDLSNQLQVSQMNGLAGKSLYLQVGLTFTMGNYLRKNSDRRWAQ